MPSRIPNVTRQTKVSNANGYYLRCRDVDGTSVMITQTATGLGAHTRWIYPEQDTNNNEETGMDVDEEGDATPPPSTMTCFPQTPMPQHAFDAGSVLRTPVKRPQPLQRSPERIGFKGINFWHKNSLGTRTVEQTSSGIRVRYVLQRPVGSTTNLTKEEILEHEFQRNHETFLTQVGKLLGREEKERVAREMNSILPVVDTSAGASTARHVHFASPEPSIFIEEEEDVSEFGVGPTGERLNSQGLPMLGAHGTVMIDPTFKPQVRPTLPAPKAPQIQTEPAHQERTKHLGSITVEGKEWQVYKTLRPRKDGQPRIIMSSPMQPRTRKPRKSTGSSHLTRQPTILIDVI
ncbi:hypothetical protein DFJ58DRAFT_818986 [Suillus subalutaceus]|uniref:uncharacterized protein n=1 Tax=Suillus subalutaceus TaxID=48586 RepID=UPI001B87F90A|nr:uncharacterized protein DFJ58DRAFT_818986 [Suillus subalutaceus]KAG1836292.1 hypothetical protein DFJ58DRAFT_818986 [Suillus subalutaceus]